MSCPYERKIFFIFDKSVVEKSSNFKLFFDIFFINFSAISLFKIILFCSSSFSSESVFSVPMLVNSNFLENFSSSIPNNSLCYLQSC